MNTNTTQLSRFTASLSIVALVSSSCGGNKSSQTAPPLSASSPLADKVLVQAKDLPKGLDLRLSNGHAGAPAFDHSKLAAAKKLSDADAQQLLARANPIKVDASDQQAFALRPGSQPPPRTGPTVTSAFPPAASSLLAAEGQRDRQGPARAALDAGRRRARRTRAERDVQPADGRGDVAEDAAASVPVKSTPTPKGKWRWLGTRTAAVRSRSTVPASDHVPGRDSGRHQERDRRRAARRREVHVRDAAAESRGVLSPRRRTAPRRADVRSLRPAHRPRGGARAPARDRR